MPAWLAPVLGVLGPLLDRALGALLPDPQARSKFIQELFGQLQQSDLSQLEVNKQEASHDSMFVAGWRPFIGWICGTALAYQYVLMPIVMWVSFVIGKPLPKPPEIDNVMWELMFGMLGMGALRSWEKISRAAR